MSRAMRFLLALMTLTTVVCLVMAATLFLDPQTVLVMPAPAANNREPHFLVQNHGPVSIRDVSIACKPAGQTLSWMDIGYVSAQPSKNIDLAAKAAQEFSCIARGGGTDFDLLLAYDVCGIRFYRSLPIAIVNAPIFVTARVKTPTR